MRIALLATALLLASPALAQDAAVEKPAASGAPLKDLASNPSLRAVPSAVKPDVNCPPMAQNVSLNVNFNFQSPTVKDAKERFDARIKSIEDFLKKNKVEKWSLQSMNYSVSTQGNSEIGENSYQISGSANYQLSDADQAFALMDLLTKQKMYVSVNVNKYRNGVCQEG